MATDFFDELPEWSARKHSLIKKYVASAARILGSENTWKQLYYIDGFAGRGRYGNPEKGKDFEPGSPVLMADLARESEEKGHRYRLRCINVEADKGNFESLQQTTEPYGDLVTNFYGEFNDHLDEILQIVRGQPVVAFLDPFGIKGIPMSCVGKLLARPEPTDLWVRFDVSQVYRRCGYFGTSTPGADAHFQLVCDIYGIYDAQALFAQLTRPTGVSQRHKTAVRLYFNQLLPQFSGRMTSRRYAGSYAIGSIEKQVKYYLVFATANKLAFAITGDLVCREHDNYELNVARHQNETKPTLFSLLGEPDPREKRDAKVRDLMEDIINRFAGKEMVRLDITVELYLDGWYGKATQSDINKALKNLITEGKATLLRGTVSDRLARLSFV